VFAPERFSELRNDERLGVLLALGCCLNQLRFAHEAFHGIGTDETSPHARRQLIAAVFAIASSLREGVDLARVRLGRHFSHLDSFTLLSELWRDPKYKALFDDHVRELRNRAVSHFDHDEIMERLAGLEFSDEVVVVDEECASSLHSHCRLSDVLATMTLAQSFSTAAELNKKVDDLSRLIAAASPKFLSSAQKLITDALTTLGAKRLPWRGDG